MVTGRTWHKAARLADGKVLLAGGGELAAVTYDTAQLYDPASGTFDNTASMAARRILFTLTRLDNGKVLAAGGRTYNDNIFLSSAELFDPDAGTFSPTAEPMGTARWLHTATLLPNGKVLIAGGIGGSWNTLSSAELYDPATGMFTATGSMATGRYKHSATLLANGKVLIAAGVGGADASILSSAELYDPATGTFSSTGSLATAREEHKDTLLPNGKVLITGGYDLPLGGDPLASAELYNPATGTFTTTGSMAVARYEHTSTLLPNGKVLSRVEPSGGPARKRPSLPPSCTTPIRGLSAARIRWGPPDIHTPRRCSQTAGSW